MRWLRDMESGVARVRYRCAMADPYKILRQAGGRNTVQVGCVGGGSFALGLFMVALHAAGLDPELAHASAVVVVLLYAFAFVFMGGGGARRGGSIFKSGGQLADLEQRLRDRPQTILRAWRQVATRRAIEGAQGERKLGQHMVVIEADDGTTWSINARASQVSDILKLVASRNPDAEVRGL